MLACQTAVTLAPNDPGIADSRGVARAMIGDFVGAIADFRFFVRAGGFAGSQCQGNQREVWIEKLMAGINPLDNPRLCQIAASFKIDDEKGNCDKIILSSPYSNHRYPFHQLLHS